MRRGFKSCNFGGEGKLHGHLAVSNSKLGGKVEEAIADKELLSWCNLSSLHMRPEYSYTEYCIRVFTRW